MSGPSILEPEVVAEANAIAMQIGETFRRERVRRGESLRKVAAFLGLNPLSYTNISRFERGERTDITLGQIVRNLGAYGYTIKVTKIRRPRATRSL